MKAQGFKLLVVTNQPDLAKGLATQEDVTRSTRNWPQRCLWMSFCVPACGWRQLRLPQAQSGAAPGGAEAPYRSLREFHDRRPLARLEAGQNVVSHGFDRSGIPGEAPARPPDAIVHSLGKRPTGFCMHIPLVRRDEVTSQLAVKIYGDGATLPESAN